MIFQKFFPGVLFFLSSSMLYAQFGGQALSQRMLYKMNSRASLNLDASGVEIQGSPYLTDEFVKGIVFSNEGKPFELPIRYNIYSDNIEYTQNQVVYALDASSPIKKIAYGGNVFVIEKYEYKKIEKRGFLVLADSGKVSLLLKKVVVFQESEAPKPMEYAGKPPKYVRQSDVVYFKIANGETKKFASIEKLIASLPDKQEEVTAYAKKNKLSSRKDEDIIELVRYYNSLI